MIERKLTGFRKGLAGLLIGASLAFSGCNDTNLPHAGNLKLKGDKITLEISQDGSISFGDNRDIVGDLTYSGMPNSDTFMLSYIGGDNQNFSIPYYYPVEANEINYRGVRLKIIYVNPEEIKLERAE